MPKKTFNCLCYPLDFSFLTIQIQSNASQLQSYCVVCLIVAFLRMVQLHQAKSLLYVRGLQSLLTKNQIFFISKLLLNATSWIRLWFTVEIVENCSWFQWLKSVCIALNIFREYSTNRIQLSYKTCRFYFNS